MCKVLVERAFLKYKMTVTEPISMKLALARQLSVNNSYTIFHGNLTKLYSPILHHAHGVVQPDFAL